MIEFDKERKISRLNLDYVSGTSIERKVEYAYDSEILRVQIRF